MWKALREIPIILKLLMAPISLPEGNNNLKKDSCVVVLGVFYGHVFLHA